MLRWNNRTMHAPFWLANFIYEHFFKMLFLNWKDFKESSLLVKSHYALDGDILGAPHISKLLQIKAFKVSPNYISLSTSYLLKVICKSWCTGFSFPLSLSLSLWCCMTTDSSICVLCLLPGGSLLLSPVLTSCSNLPASYAGPGRPAARYSV